jgi:hypothetical protein
MNKSARFSLATIAIAVGTLYGPWPADADYIQTNLVSDNPRTRHHHRSKPSEPLGVVRTAFVRCMTNASTNGGARLVPRASSRAKQTPSASTSMDQI